MIEVSFLGYHVEQRVDLGSNREPAQVIHS